MRVLLKVFEVDAENDLLLQSGLTDDEASALLRYMTKEHAATAVKPFLLECEGQSDREASKRKKRGKEPSDGTPLKTLKRDTKRASEAQVQKGMSAAALEVQRDMQRKPSSELYRLHVRNDGAEVVQCMSKHHKKQVPQLNGLCVFVRGLVQPRFGIPATWTTFWFCPTVQCLKASVKKETTSSVPLFSQTGGVTQPANLALTDAQRKAVKFLQTEDHVTVTVRK